MKYYIDSCIWIDYFENRSDKFKPLGEWALNLINKIINEDSFFVLSDHILKELEFYYSKEELNSFLNIIPKKLINYTNTNKKQIKEAISIKNKLKIPFGDALHAVLARDNKSIMITRDKHFYRLSNKFNIKKPEDLI